MADEKPSPQLSQPLLPPPQTTPHYAYPAPSYPPPPTPQPYVLVPVLVRVRRRRNPCRRCARLLLAPSCAILLLLLALLAFLLYPSAPAVRIAELRLDRLRIAPPPRAELDLALALRLRLRNPNLLLPVHYHQVSSSVAYRGRLLGSAAARPRSGELAAGGETYADAEVWADVSRVLDDALELIGDLAAGSVPLETMTEVVGAIRVFHFNIPVKGVVSCSLNVSPDTQRIISQNCYTE